jgi:TetR/AcrR family transcriptional regulator, cholesterol catabolism regulator
VPYASHEPMSDPARRSRIVDVAIKLSQRGGFESVGLREVAEEVGVALGTLYKTFRSKEEIISAAVEQQTMHLRRTFTKHPAQGETAVDRIENLYTRLTRALIRRPAYARAVLVSLVSNHADIAGSVFRYEDEMTRIAIAALRGISPVDVDLATVNEDEEAIAFSVRQVWFASLVGWGGGLYSPSDISRHVRTAARLLIAGAERREEK